MNQSASLLSLLLLLVDCQVATWGGNDKGQLGLADTNDRVTPTLVTFAGSVVMIFYAITAHDSLSCNSIHARRHYSKAHQIGIVQE